MNPLLLLLPIAAYLYLSSKEKADKEKVDKGKGSGKSPAGKATETDEDEEPELAGQTVYEDTSRIPWKIRQKTPSLWTGEPQYSASVDLPTLSASTRSELIKSIEKVTRKRRDETLGPRKEGAAAGEADAEDSIKAYADAIIKWHTKIVSKRYDEAKSDLWKIGYREGFDRGLGDLYLVDEDGYISKKGD